MSLSKLSLESGCTSATKNDDDDATNTQTKEIRVFMDGAFDMMHFGHMNAFRLGRSLGTHLLVGINSDESIAECKGGLPLLNDEERQTMVESCKFVDEVVPNCPYIMNESYLNYILQEYRVDYVIHGDDPCLVDGKDVYATAKQAGKFKSIPRTEGISTTDLVGRVLALHASNLASNSSPLGYTSRFLTTTSLLAAFRSNNPSPKPGMKIVYVDGDFDMFHCGHVAFLQVAKQKGDYLLVGIHGDALVHKMKGSRFPLQNAYERSLSVLGCRFVDDVLLDAPYEVTSAMIDTLQIKQVIKFGSDGISNKSDMENDTASNSSLEIDRFLDPRQAGILEVIEDSSGFSIDKVFRRILDDEETFQRKYNRKLQAEQEFLQEKYGKSRDFSETI